MTAYDSKRTVELSLGDWLDVLCALADGSRYNELQAWPIHAAEISMLRSRIRSMIADDLNAAIAAARRERCADQDHAQL